MTDLKNKHPKLKVLLSVGGNEDVSGEGSEKNLKYREVVSRKFENIIDGQIQKIQYFIVD